MHLIVHPTSVELRDDEGSIVATGHFEVDGIPLVEGTRFSGVTLVLDVVRVSAAQPEIRLAP